MYYEEHRMTMSVGEMWTRDNRHLESYVFARWRVCTLVRWLVSR